MRSILPVGARAALFCSRGVVAAFVLVAATMALAPGPAEAQQCPEATPTYTDSCGPTFVLPPWGDGGGWTDPSKYSTIQLGDVNGDGSDELIARNDQGIEIYWFDTSLGQWRPQADANGLPQVLTAFRSPLPTESPATDWTKPQYYSTIQAADVDGEPGAEILARSADGMHVYKYTPPDADRSIDGGTWQPIGTGGPFSDAAGGSDPSVYSTIQVGKFRAPDLPLMFARLNVTGEAADGGDEPTVIFYRWDAASGSWAALPVNDWYINVFGNDNGCAHPSCYLDLQTGNFAPRADVDPADTAQVIGRPFGGVVTAMMYQGGWFEDPQNNIFGDDAAPGDVRIVDCPFSNGGASGAGSGDCLGSSPSYYETMQAADIDGDGLDELVARASDGLRVKKHDSVTGLIRTLPTLTDLAGGAANVAPALWGTIRTGDIDGNTREEVLALTGGGLQAWSYDPASKAWQRLQPATPLALTGEWLTKPEYYSTIETGDVDGDGRADVVARGRFGIRTWFYERRGSSGWERYLPDGYTNFPLAPCPAGVTGPCGQQAAFTALNGLAQDQGIITGGTIRRIWLGENRPDPTVAPFSRLASDLVDERVGNCPSANKTRAEPPTYSSCIPPATSNFTAGDWTTVVNELLAESFYATQVIAHFDDIATMRENLFESQTGALPAIGADLQLNAASGTPTDFNLQSFFGGLTGITASIAGLAEAGGPELSAGLWVASEIISMLPSASPTANSSFQTTYDGLLTKIATAQEEMAQEVVSQSQQVRGDQGLLGVVGQLRARGTWMPNLDGLESTSRQAFVTETYKALVPTVYNRYWVQNCANNGTGRYCRGPSPGPGVMGNSQSFRTIGLPPATSLGLPSTPCIYHQNTGSYYCYYDTNSPPAALMSRIWGPVSPTCNYQPGNAATAWTFGCNLGIPTATSIGNSPWPFHTYAGNPVTYNPGGAAGAASATSGVVRASAVQAGSSALASREVLGPLRFTGRVFFSRGVRLRRMRLVVARTLFEHGRREELARSRSGRRLRPFALRQVRPGVFTSRRRGGPRVRLHLRRLDQRGAAQLDLRLTRVRTRDIRALCTVLPASVHRAGRPLELETRLRLRDRGVTHAIAMRQHWRCVRDRKHEFTGIRPIKTERPVARPGLTLRMKKPRVRASGRRATVRITIANQRRPRPTRAASSLWDLRITGSSGGPPRTVRVKELRARRSRTVRLTMPVPRSARGRVCVQVAATAPSARSAGARRCARIAGAPRVDACAAVRGAACPPAPHRRAAARTRPQAK